MSNIHRRELVKKLVEHRPDNLMAVSSLGSSTWDLTASGDDPRNFCFIGAMGQAAPFALGLAIAQPDKRVVLIAGDGEVLMGLGALATIANQAPKNLSIIVLDNESYVETGNQPTATSGKTNLTAVAAACGFEYVSDVTDASGVDGLIKTVYEARSLNFTTVKIINESLPLVFPFSFDGAEAFNRFQIAAMG
jgi:thiamine pyrophosphate-dependent acetolactate synthase large subunit-like protein